ncbi:hypothetical protein HYQ46_000253 [Verticillium longisporum]|nr:hypothetical protein HYQ46_000253 [Verticillium longisporum]
MSIFFWVKSGHREPGDGSQKSRSGPGSAGSTTVQRELFVPLLAVTISQFLGVFPLFLFNHLPANVLSVAFSAFAGSFLSSFSTICQQTCSPWLSQLLWF